MRKSGIYIISCLISGKCYIGSAKNFNRRWSDHKKELRGNYHHSIKLQHAWNKYKEENFVFQILEYCEIKDLIEIEQYYIDSFDSYHNGYNSVPKAGSNLGSKKSPEELIKMSIRMKGKFVGDKNPNFGRKHTDEEKRLMKLNHWSRKGKKPYNLGIPCPEELKEKIRNSRATIIDFCFISPENIIYFGNNITQFCKEHKLNCSNMIKLQKGERFHWKNWVKAPNNLKKFDNIQLVDYATQQRQKSRQVGNQKKCKIFEFLSPENEIIKIDNLPKFCKENELNYNSMFFVYHGTNNYKSHKGYRTAKKIQIK